MAIFKNGKRSLRIKLDSLGHILKEMARVYREMRAGIIDTQEGARLIASLAVMRQTQEQMLYEQELLKMKHELSLLQNRGDRPMLTTVK